MEFSESAIQTIKNFNEDPSNPRTVYALGSLYWSTVTAKLGTLLREKEDFREFINNESDFLNYGLVPEIREDHEAVALTLKGNYRSYPHLKTRQFSDWLIETIEEIVEGNQKDMLAQDIKRSKVQIKRLASDVEAVQQKRKELILAQLSTGSSVPGGKLLAQLNRLVKTEELQIDSMRTKKAIAKGTFFSVEQRREFVGRESHLQKEQAKCEALFTQIKSKAERAACNNCNARVNELFSKIIDLEDNIVKMKKKIEEIQEKQHTISPAEVENKVIRAIEYIRDLVKLSAKRLRAESCSILRPKDPFFTSQQLFSCLDRVHEFDPRVFCNDRVSFLGKPSVLLVPGNGNAIYDWKNNQFIVPLVPPAGDFVGSIAAAIIEYRFDVDDEKKLLNSYTKLPEYRDIRSIFQLKAKLTKDYLAWMTSEYKGFRVLSKDAKKWFEHEVAPSRKEIFCPPQYQAFNMNAKQFRTMLDEVESRIGDVLDEVREEDLWVASILNYQQGKFERAFEHLKMLLDKNQQHLFGYYNLGHVGMKISRKQEAIHGFSEFSKRHPQSWWAAVARDHMRHLQMS